jgi:exopolyphosphatase / guanosine-5'-triphosphate,3'-diphosphate pyrophosphatase
LKIAIIDIGTNTFKLMISRVRVSGEVSLIDKEKIPVKLGEGGLHEGKINEQAFLRGVNALKALKSKIDRFQVDLTLAFATSAIRSSLNGKDFVKKVREETGIRIQTISGEKEAELIYFGVRQALDIGPEKALIMDIGGGSTEFIIADRDQIWWKHSFDLGASRLLQEINPSDPIRREEIRHLKDHLREQLSLLWAACEIHPVKTLIGSSGSFDSLAEMIWHRFHTEENPLVKTEYHFNLAHFDQMYKILLDSTIEKRFRMKGLAPMRVEMIVVAVILIKFVLKKLKLSEMRLSTYSLKEGMLFNYLEQEKNGQDTDRG